MVPIFKTGDSSALTNYRPISVLTFFVKVFEKIVYNKLLNLIIDINILYDYQYGFCKGRSTQQAIITLVEIRGVINVNKFEVRLLLPSSHLR